MGDQTRTMLRPAALALCFGAGVADAASYGDARSGCATDELAAKFPRGGAMCLPRCGAASACPAAPGGASAVPTCEFSEGSAAEYCGLRCEGDAACPAGTACQSGVCAFPFDVMAHLGESLEAEALDKQLRMAYSALEETPDPDALPIVGQAPWRYRFEPLKLQMPANSNPPYSHGLEVDDDSNLYLTYYDKGDPGRCLLKWSPADGYEKFEVVGHGSEMCNIGNANTGPHGLRIAKEPNGTQVFYMANNNQALFKTTLEGDVIWSVYNRPSTNPADEKKNATTKCEFGSGPAKDGYAHGYCPTWFENQPGSDFLCAGHFCARCAVPAR